MSNDTFRDYLNNKLGSIDSHVSELIPDTAEIRSMRINNPELYKDFIDRWLTTIDDHIVDIINGGGIHPGPTPPTPSYNIYYEDINCRYNATSFVRDRSILNIYDTYPILKSSNNRNWEILLNFENMQTDTSERAVLGIGASSRPAFEIFMKGTSADTIFYNRMIDGTSTTHNDIIYNGNLNNTDIIIRRTGTILEVIKGDDNTVLLTKTFQPTYDSNSNNINVGVFVGSNNYYFVGVINKFGFKWLS